ncbi:MAG TPA: hypothetical protein VJM32_03830 [Candidatus Saccharimonadales bacterium]|nr:hypothetical protein [Candidatus Saccharimonadales bacterium]
MEQTIFEPIYRGPRHQRVELEDLSGYSPAAVVGESEFAPASPEHIDYLWQREAAFSALRGIQEVAARGGLHRREESFAEIARDEISVRARRLFGKIASIGSGVREWGKGLRENLAMSREATEYGTLADLGFTGIDTQVPDSPAAVTRSFTTEELLQMQEIVRERRTADGVAGVYESQNV